MNKSLSEYLGYKKHQTRKSQNGARNIVPKKMLKIWETLIENWFTIEKNNGKLTALLCLKNKSAVILGENMQNNIKILPLTTMLALAACAVQSQGIYNSASGFIPSISRSIEREL